MPRPEIMPPVLPDVPFELLLPADQARCVGWNLRAARKAAGLTMPELVALMQSSAPKEAISLSYVGDIERGQRNPTLSTILVLARTLQIDPKALLRHPPKASTSPNKGDRFSANAA